LTLTRTTVSDNLGGGIYVSSDGSLTDSTITRNQGDDNNTAAGIHVVGSVNVDHSTISDNQGGGNRNIGGGLYVDGTPTLVKSTISGNAAQGDVGVGGGVMLFNGWATFTNTTISGNLALTGDVGVGYGGSGGGIFSSGISPELTGPGGAVTL